VTLEKKEKTVRKKPSSRFEGSFTKRSPKEGEKDKKRGRHEGHLVKKKTGESGRPAREGRSRFYLGRRGFQERKRPSCLVERKLGSGTLRGLPSPLLERKSPPQEDKTRSSVEKKKTGQKSRERTYKRETICVLRLPGKGLGGKVSYL